MTEAKINEVTHATFDYGKQAAQGKMCDFQEITLASGDTLTSLSDAEGTYFETRFNDEPLKRSNTFDATTASSKKHS